MIEIINQNNNVYIVNQTVKLSVKDKFVELFKAIFFAIRNFFDLSYCHLRDKAWKRLTTNQRKYKAQINPVDFLRSGQILKGKIANQQQVLKKIEVIREQTITPDKFNLTKWTHRRDILEYCKYQYANMQRKSFQNFNFFVTDKDAILDSSSMYYSQLSEYLNKSLSQKALFFLPLLIDQHWYLIVVDPSKKNVEYYDSLGSSISAATQLCIDEIHKIINFISEKEYNFISGIGVHQKNDHDCGPFVCYYMEKRLQGNSFSEIQALQADYLEEDVKQYRKTMYSYLDREFS